MRFSSPRHLLVGVTFDSWCGIYGVVNRGLAATRDETKMSCGNCRRSLNAHRKQETAKDRQGLGEPPKRHPKELIMFSGSTIRSMQEEAAVKAARERRVPFVVWPGDDLSSFPFPFLGDYVPKGWERLPTEGTGLTRSDLPGVTDREHVQALVDSSGFGGDDGRSLEPEGLRALIERLNVWANEQKVTVGWAIIEVGQFQVVVGAYTKPIPESELRALHGDK